MMKFGHWIAFCVAFLSSQANAQYGSTASPCVWSGVYADCLPSAGLLLRDGRAAYFREQTVNGTDYVSIAAPGSLSAPVVLTWPSSAGSAGNWLTSSGAGVLSFTNTVTTAKTIDGSADVVQLTVEGNSSQGNDIFVVQDSTTQNLMRVTNTAGTALRGSTNNTAAAVGYVGEIISASLSASTPTSMTTATPKTVTSITLTPGDWNIQGILYWLPAASTNVTVFTESISATTNTLASAFGIPNAAGELTMAIGMPPSVVGANSITRAVPLHQVLVANGTTKTMYLVGSANYTVSTMQAAGWIAAQRVR